MEGKTLTEAEARNVMDEIMKGYATPSQIASFLTVLRFRGETVDEMTGFAQAMRSHAITIPHTFEDVVDTCGTGGDGANTFNISTTTALVLSAMGVKVAKHGNRAVSSKSGSADVLEELNIPIQSTPEAAAEALEKQNMSFLFAPIYHVAMKYAVTPRSEIGFRTVFNVLGPLTNPARAKHQLIGVYDTGFAKKMAETLNRLGTKHALFVTGEDGMDECSITGTTQVVEVKDGKVTQYTLTPEDVGLTRGRLEDLQVSSAAESGELIKQVLAGEANDSAQQIVLFNAGAALYVADRVKSIREGVELVREAVERGDVYRHFLTLQRERKESQHA